MELRSAITFTPEVAKKASKLYMKASSKVTRVVVNLSMFHVTIIILAYFLMFWLQQMVPEIFFTVFMHVVSAFLGFAIGIFFILRLLAVPEGTTHVKYCFREQVIEADNEICQSRYEWEAIQEVVRDEELVLLVLKLTRQFMVLDAKEVSAELNELIARKIPACSSDGTLQA